MGNFIIANSTNTGRVRQVNEDSMVTFDSPNGRVVAVCDGMGGQNAGDVASQIAVAVIQDILTNNSFNTPEEAITRSIGAANQAILHRAAQDPNLAGMGSTCVMLIIKDGKAYYGSVGDSRIYYVCNGMIRQITKDQSYVQTLVDAGEISPEEATHHKDKNQITNALGIEGMTPPVIGQMPIKPEPGSVFILCSDGLSGMVNNNGIFNVVSNTSMSLSDRAEMLVRLANEAGGIDNITVQLVEFTAGNATAVPTQPLSPSANAKVHKNKSVIYGVITGLIILIGGGVAFWLLTDKKEEAKATSNFEPQVETVKSSSTSTTASPSKSSTSSRTVTKETVVVVEKTTPSKKNASDKRNGAYKASQKITARDRGKNPTAGTSENAEAVTNQNNVVETPKPPIKRENNAKEKELQNDKPFVN